MRPVPLYRLISFLLTSMALGSLVSAQPYRASVISLSEGLSQSSVYAIEQDKKGFTWLATQDGLNRYDGISFTVYREEPFDTQSVSSGNISALYCDGKGQLWVGTNGGGLNLFQAASGTFKHLNSNSENGPGRIINAITGDHSGNIWVAADNGLFRIADGKQISNCPLRHQNTDSVPDKFVNSLLCDKQGNIWAGTLQGLFLISNGSILTGLPDAEWISAPGNVGVNCIEQDARGNIWIGTRKGIFVLSSTSTAARQIVVSGSFQSGMRSNVVNRLFLDSSGEMWVGYPEHGVQTASFSGTSDTLLFSDVDAMNRPGILNTGNSLSFFEDRITPGMIWAGFNAGGVVKLAPVTKKFHTDKLNAPGIVSPFVTSLVKDKNEVVWIATSSGLVRKNIANKQYSVLMPTKLISDPGIENYIGGVAVCNNGEVVFTSGLKVLRTDASGKSCVAVANSSGEDNYFRTLASATDGNIYALTRYSILKYDQSTHALVPYLKVNDAARLRDKGFYISCLLHDSKGNIWVGTSAGLDFYAKGDLSRKPVTYRHDRKDTTSLRSQTILGFFEDRKGNVWIGTMNGLSRAVAEGKGHIFVNYSTHNGLSNNVVYAIIQDTQSNKLWVSTNNGLNLFDPGGTTTQIFDVHDGIQSNEFNSYAGSVSADGEIFFGGIEGYTSFYPAGIAADTTAPRVSVTGITLANGRFVPFENTSEIDLKYRDNNFTISFIGLHYVDPAKNQYAYKLEGFQDDWIFVEGTPRVNFSQLPPGKYTFRIKASNSDGKFSTADASVTINLLPPFYKTIWFFLLVILFILGVFYALHKYRLRMKLEQIHEIEKLRKATAADFHDELGHKLTIISWFAEILKKKIGPEQTDLRPHLDKIIETSGNLYHTMKDMLWAMDPDKDSVYELYNQIRDFGQGLFDETGVMFEAEEVSEELKESMVSPSQRRHVLLIFKEVMHNALKHSGSTETRLTLSSSDKEVVLSFRDNGKGFRMNGQNVGHGLNNVKRRAQMIDAAVSIQSENGGTVAKLTLPLN